MRTSTPALAILTIAAILSACGPTDFAVSIQASAETDPVHHRGDAADDPSIWVHPGDAAQSLVIADDKQGGLVVYDLEGNERQWVDPDLRLNNVDLRYAFPLIGSYVSGVEHTAVDLVVVGNESDDSLRCYKVDPATRTVEVVGDQPTGRAEPYGGCMYRSQIDDRFYYFAVYRSGQVEQWELTDNGSGGVAISKRREFDVGSQSEGCVADDDNAVFYIGEEAQAIWRYGAEPDAGAARVRVGSSGTHFRADVEGLCLYHAAGRSGYLIASSQGDGTFRIFERDFVAGRANAYLGAVRIARGTVDGVSDTDGIEVGNAALSAAFPSGMLVVQDGANSAPGNAGNQNYKLVPWERVAAAFHPALAIDTSYDPRAAAPVLPIGRE